MSEKSESKRIGIAHNHLIHEKSPYLLQHAYNPVAWHPWGEDAFQKAYEENKLIFLSIGYSTCHWCHVMAHESFEDPEVAELMNEFFISIKVDREERPDIDNLYMSVCQLMTGRGGWPLTIIMTPDKKPVFAGTYIPKISRFGQIGMLDLIPRIKEIWQTRYEEVMDSSERITCSLQNIMKNPPEEELDTSILKIAYDQLADRFDEIHGGFGNAPKFPTPHTLLFLLRYWKRSGHKKALDMVEGTLHAMGRGGIYDHIGFGVHRYSTDAEWLVPHFEKMLYDQALVAMAYTEAYQATIKEEYGKIAREIFTYVLRDMTAEEGGFYSAEDADSEGQEGKFYLWTKDEIFHILSKEEADLVIHAFTVEKQGNFAEEATGMRTGFNILHRTEEDRDLALEFGISEKEFKDRLQKAQEKLFAVREKRIHPQKDDKILADWSGLMIAALAKGAKVFDDLQYALAAGRAADFVLNTMRDPEGRLFHRYRDGHLAFQAYVNDYAFMIWGLLELYEALFDVRYLEAALELNNDLIKHFWDDKDKGFFFTSDDGEDLLVRQKEIYDGAVPSGNSIAMLNLLRLAHLTGNAEFEDKAAKIGDFFSHHVKQLPSAYTQFLVALDFGLGPSHEVVIAGSLVAQDTREMLMALRSQYIPNKVVIFRPDEQDAQNITRIAKFTQQQTSINGKATAYICSHNVCKLPTTRIVEILELLNN